LASFTKLNLR